MKVFSITYQEKFLFIHQEKWKFSNSHRRKKRKFRYSYIRKSESFLFIHHGKWKFSNSYISKVKFGEKIMGAKWQLEESQSWLASPRAPFLIHVSVNLTAVTTLKREFVIALKERKSISDGWSTVVLYVDWIRMGYKQAESVDIGRAWSA